MIGWRVHMMLITIANDFSFSWWIIFYILSSLSGIIPLLIVIHQSYSFFHYWEKHFGILKTPFLGFFSILNVFFGFNLRFPYMVLFLCSGIREDMYLQIASQLFWKATGQFPQKSKWLWNKAHMPIGSCVGYHLHVF